MPGTCPGRVLSRALGLRLRALLSPTFSVSRPAGHGF